jgi:hypothetical protein
MYSAPTAIWSAACDLIIFSFLRRTIVYAALTYNYVDSLAEVSTFSLIIFQDPVMYTLCRFSEGANLLEILPATVP